jgi:multimeric flavodoxin WrbA
MKVLGIVGSPRKGGNTEIMVEEALATARKAGAETEIVLVADKKIAGCDACRTCFETDECRIKDDMQPLYEQMEEADAIILGTPVYFHNVSAQLKAIMDRTFVFLIRMRLKGKVAAPITALRRIGAGTTRNLLYGFFLAHGMTPVRGAAGYGPEKGEVRQGFGGGRDISAMEEARNVGMDIVDLLQKLS